MSKLTRSSRFAKRKLKLKDSPEVGRGTRSGVGSGVGRGVGKGVGCVVIGGGRIIVGGGGLTVG